MYAVKITVEFLGFELAQYVGKRGESKKSLDKVEGWKKRESAEKYIAKAVCFDEMFGYEGREYEIVTL